MRKSRPKVPIRHADDLDAALMQNADNTGESEMFINVHYDQHVSQASFEQIVAAIQAWQSQRVSIDGTNYRVASAFTFTLNQGTIHFRVKIPWLVRRTILQSLLDHLAGCAVPFAFVTLGAEIVDIKDKHWRRKYYG